MTDQHPPDNPNDQDQARAVFDAVGGKPFVNTTGELVALLANLPADTPLLVDEIVRCNPFTGLKEFGAALVTAVVAEPLVLDRSMEDKARPRAADGSEYPTRGTAVRLGVRVMLESDRDGTTATEAYRDVDSLYPMLQNGDVPGYLTNLGRQLGRYASDLTGDVRDQVTAPESHRILGSLSEKLGWISQSMTWDARDVARHEAGSS